MRGEERVQEIKPKEAVIIKKNKSCFFILPLLGQPSYWYYGIINCYLRDIINKPEFDNQKLFLNVKTYDNKLAVTKYFNQFYQLEDGSYMYIFDIPKQYNNDYNRFCQGRYSEMSEDAKQVICRLSGIKPIQNSTVYKVLYKTSDQKKKIEDSIGVELPIDAEVYSVPNIDKETYSLYCIKGYNRSLERRESAGEEIL